MLFPSPIVAIIDRAFSPLANINYVPKEAKKRRRTKLVLQKSTGRGRFCWENLKPAIPVIQMDYSESETNPWRTLALPLKRRREASTRLTNNRTLTLRMRECIFG